MSLEDLARRDAAELLYRGLDAVVKELPRIAEMATQEERVAVVAWLKKQRMYCTDSTGEPNAVTATYAHAADAIERGEHRREENQ